MPAIYMSDRSSIRQLGVLQLASAFGVCLGAQKQSLRFVLSGFLCCYGACDLAHFHLCGSYPVKPKKKKNRQPRHAQRTTGHALGHVAQDVRLAGDVRYAPNMSALAVNVTREGPQTGAHKQGAEHSPTSTSSW